MDPLTSRLPALGHLSFGWRDALDIAIVALITYGLLRLIRGTRAVQMVLGLFAIFAVYAVAALLRLSALSTVLKALIFYVPFAIIVLFTAFQRWVLRERPVSKRRARAYQVPPRPSTASPAVAASARVPTVPDPMQTKEDER